MLHTWTRYSASYITIADQRDALVRTKPSPNGTYLWQFGKRYGNSPTIDEAKAWVEALADQAAIPREQRWLSII